MPITFAPAIEEDEEQSVSFAPAVEESVVSFAPAVEETSEPKNLEEVYDNLIGAAFTTIKGGGLPALDAAFGFIRGIPQFIGAAGAFLGSAAIKSGAQPVIPDSSIQPIDTPPIPGGLPANQVYHGAKADASAFMEGTDPYVRPFSKSGQQVLGAIGSGVSFVANSISRGFWDIMLTDPSDPVQSKMTLDQKLADLSDPNTKLAVEVGMDATKLGIETYVYAKGTVGIKDIFSDYKKLYAAKKEAKAYGDDFTMLSTTDLGIYKDKSELIDAFKALRRKGQYDETTGKTTYDKDTTNKLEEIRTIMDNSFTIPGEIREGHTFALIESPMVKVGEFVKSAEEVMQAEGVTDLANWKYPPDILKKIESETGEPLAERNFADILKDINEAVGEVGAVGKVELTSAQKKARERLLKDADKVAGKAAELGMSLGDYLKKVGITDKSFHVAMAEAVTKKETPIENAPVFKGTDPIKEMEKTRNAKKTKAEEATGKEEVQEGSTKEEELRQGLVSALKEIDADGSTLWESLSTDQLTAKLKSEIKKLEKELTDGVKVTEKPAKTGAPIPKPKTVTLTDVRREAESLSFNVDARIQHDGSILINFADAKRVEHYHQFTSLFEAHKFIQELKAGKAPSEAVESSRQAAVENAPELVVPKAESKLTKAVEKAVAKEHKTVIKELKKAKTEPAKESVKEPVKKETAKKAEPAKAAAKEKVKAEEELPPDEQINMAEEFEGKYKGVTAEELSKALKEESEGHVDPIELVREYEPLEVWDEKQKKMVPRIDWVYPDKNQPVPQPKSRLMMNKDMQQYYATKAVIGRYPIPTGGKSIGLSAIFAPLRSNVQKIEARTGYPFWNLFMRMQDGIHGEHLLSIPFVTRSNKALSGYSRVKQDELYSLITTTGLDIKNKSYAEAIRYMDKNETFKEKFKNVSEKEYYAAQEGAKILNEAGLMFGIPIERFVKDYAPRIRAAGMSVDEALQKWSLPDEYKWFAEEERTGYLSPHDTNLHRVINAYVTRGARKKALGPALDEFAVLFNKAKSGEPGRMKLTKPETAVLEKVYNDTRGYPAYLDSFMDHTVEGFVRGINTAIDKVTFGLAPKRYDNPIYEKTPTSFEVTDKKGREKTLTEDRLEKIGEAPGFFEVNDAVNRLVNMHLNLTYAGALALRPMAIVRNLAQTLMTTLPLAREHFTYGVKKAFSKEGWEEAKANLVTLDDYLPFAGEVEKGVQTKMIQASQFLLKPYTWSDNVNRVISYHAMKQKVLDNGKTYLENIDKAKSVGEATKIRDKFLDDSEITYFHPTLIKNEVMPLLIKRDIEGLAQRIGKHASDETQWVYRRANSPWFMQGRLGKVLGQFGTWPIWYVDYMRNMVSRGSKANIAKRVAMWAGVQVGLTQIGKEVFGVNLNNWVWYHPMMWGGGIAGSATAEFQNLLSDDPYTQSKAQKAMLDFAGMHVPGYIEMKNMYKAQTEFDGEDSLKKALGFTPYEE